MAYIDLNRHFVPINKDEEINLDIGRYWGKHIGGWLGWEDLLDNPRVVILAEASSGKTEEFKAITEKLRNKGKAAFFISIEELADEGFDQSLTISDVSLFETWKHNVEEGYFFLDSLDEARLNRKSFEKALRKLAQTLSHSLQRCRFFISCRVTDWKGIEDYQIIKQLLPLPDINPFPKQEIESESALLAPLFKDHETNKQDKNKNKNTDDEIVIVRLTPLDNDQQCLLAQNHGVEDISQFSFAIWQQGLENLAERPGDLLELASYWNSNQRFGSLLEMTEDAVNQKLTERDPYRPDNNILNSKKARDGAERIASALTLGKTYTLQTPDASSSVDILDPRKLLDWTDAECYALLRKGIFAPATYGRIRFHHRSTQEYLTAQWLNHLLQKGCPRSEIFSLLFTEVYGVKAVIPSLKPIAAWLALYQDDIRDEILKRDPLILIQYGDPSSLSVETRCRLLKSYAKMHEAGDIANDSLDHRALWMFTHPDLAGTIRDVWNHCNDYDFRGDLIRLIREGTISDCCDLVAQVAEDTEANEYHRIVSVQALNACNKTKTLLTIADKLVQNASNFNTRLATGFAIELFPAYLDVDQLISLITNTLPPTRNSTQGFAYALEELWQKCPVESKIRFIGSLADLALSKPVCKYRNISEQYGFLANNFESIAHQVIVDLGQNEPTSELIRFLMAIERAEHSYSPQELKPSLNELVQACPKIQHVLFWADVAEKIEKEDVNDYLIQHWHFHPNGRTLWKLTTKDLPWLYSDLESRLSIYDKRIALNAIVSILMLKNSLEKEKEKLFQLSQNTILLIEDLDNYFKPNQESDEMGVLNLRHEQREKKELDEKTETKASWLKFRNELIADSNQLSDPDQRFSCIHNLTCWLRLETNQGSIKAARQWHLIKKAFNDEVAIAYRDAMKAYWRETKPERPQRKGSNVTIKWSMIYPYAGIGIESDENPRWASRLTPEEVKLACAHGCISQQGYPDWLDALLDEHPSIAIPNIIKAFRSEWISTLDGCNDFLYYYRNSEKPLPPEIASKLFNIMNRNKPGKKHSLKCGLIIFQRMVFSQNQITRLKKRAITEFSHYLEQHNEEFAILYLVLLFQVDPTCALQKLHYWIESTKPEAQNAMAAYIIGEIFNRDDSYLIINSLNNSRVQILKELVILAYRVIKPIDDVIHEELFTPDSRDKEESARGAVLSALHNSIGGDAYRAMIELADTPEIGGRKHRFRQLARDMAERDAEFPAWTENETLTFENRHIAPINNGEALYQCILNVLGDIRHGFTDNDTSSKRLLSKLAEIKKDDEESVQNWLAEQLNLRANGRYHVHREAEVAEHNMPDIIISGTSGQFEVAIEVKQADSWSPKQLKVALTQQLAEDYLKPQSRRHGILFLTDHGRRNWTGLNFIELQKYLSDVATTTKNNTTGIVNVSIFGIDGTVEK